MNVLITGSGGFVGKRLAAALKKKRHLVKEFSRGQGKDVRNFEHLKESVKGTDAVVHLAAELDENSPELFSVNVDGTKNLLEAGAKAGVGKFIHLSSCGVMGKLKGKADEKTPVNPETKYEESKAEAEKIVLSYQEIMPVMVLRSALVYGNNNYWRKIVRFIQRGFPLIGGGKNSWQMIYVDDLVSAIVFALEQEESSGEIYIVAEEKGKKLRDVYEIIYRELGIKKSVGSMPYSVAKLLSYFSLLKSKILGGKTILTPAHVKRVVRERNYSIDKIKKLGWKPKYSTEQGIKEMLKEMREEKFIG
ncbi:MAG: NAD-dependent epimerase/dehydratase family protein [Candidatus Diapherotrites archaeon]